MSLKIDQDHSRFRAIVRGKIRQNLRKYISQGELIGRKGKDLVSIPIPQIDIPHFSFGDRQRGGAGQGDGDPGDPIGGDADGEEPGDGRQAGSAPGEHALEVDVTLDELAAILGEELELPDIEDKGKSKIINAKDRYTSIRRVGPESLRNFKRTYREALKRQIAMGTYAPGNPVVVPIPSDKRYRSWKTEAEPVANAVIVYMMDVSGLDGRRTEGDRPHRELLDRCVAPEAVQGTGEPLHHPRRRCARGRSRDLLPHARERRHDDLERVQALLAAHRRPLPARGVEHLSFPLLGRRQLVDG